MKNLILKRLGLGLCLFLLISACSFLLIHRLPGNFFDTLALQQSVAPEITENLKMHFALNRPWYSQYFSWLTQLCSGDLGYSFAHALPVTTLLWQRFPSTFLLMATALVGSWAFALILGMFAAYHAHGIWDRCLRGISYLGLSCPEFFLGLLLLTIFTQTELLPWGGCAAIHADSFSPIRQIFDKLHHLLLPAFLLILVRGSTLFRMVRALCLDFKQSTFILTAKAKGLPEMKLWIPHILCNILAPLISNLGHSLACLLSGTIVVESVLNYPGLGHLLYEAFLNRDIFVILGVISINSVLLILGNLCSDLLLLWIDPRTQVQEN